MSKVAKCFKVYHYSLNKQNIFSTETKDLKNLFLIVKTHNRILGGFTSQGFGSEKFNNDGKGFIFSCKNSDETEMKDEGTQ